MKNYRILTELGGMQNNKSGIRCHFLELFTFVRHRRIELPDISIKDFPSSI